MLLKDYFPNLQKKYHKLSFKGIAFNSKEVKEGYIFFAFKGNNTDGNLFIKDAIKNGSKIIITDKLKKDGWKNNILYLNDNNLILFLVLFGFISSIYLPRDFSIKFLLYVEFTSIILLNYLFKPFAAFTIYFCFLHSMRHIIVLNKSLNLLKIKNKKATTSVFNIFNNFYKHAIKLTLISSLIFLSSMYISSNLLYVDDTLLKIIFPGLAALTLPHIILDFLYEKIKTN